MNSILLTDKEIKNINLLVEEASKVPAVEYVLIFAYYDNSYKREQIYVITGINDQPLYNFLLTGKEAYRDTFEEKEKIDKIIYTINGDYLGRLRFNDSNNYGDITNPKSINAEILKIYLTNGTILFDRFGKITEYRDAILKDQELINRYQNILEIYNIDSILKDNNTLKRIKQHPEN